MKALIVVDVQNDFLPGGALGVPGGNEILPVVNRWMEAFPRIVATRDWHPPDHGSFAVNHPGGKVFELGELDGLPQVLWPVHCVQESRGAEFADGLAVDRIDRVFSKGTRVEVDSYSGFHDNGRRHATGLGDWLRAQGVDEVAVCGLATDYCVKFTALDALREGFRTSLIVDACRGVNLEPGDVERAVEEMQSAGVEILK
ncbi:nicotinamidase/pyrazinamidase [Haloferula luteola]|uniref:Nicotinamidase n=1 Tax=Haloferula luteola TaxID=595692 RepID=A0A840V0J5_9BACT|nr:bifunctional nicotinamidase/pyrazinamidase [Haloferula luteola]MBB5351522.1 nicotinamidase/pyrazinamidase [Haloferula luteola]